MTEDDPMPDPDYIVRAHYRCYSCRYEWVTRHTGPCVCRKCGHIYVDWVNHPLNVDRENA